jgi:hypothetical protein
MNITPPPITDEQIDVALKAAMFRSTKESRKDMRAALEAAIALNNAAWLEMLAGQEAIGTVVHHNVGGSGEFVAVDWVSGRPGDGTKLYTAPVPAQAPAVAVPDGWISVDDAMPSQGALVLAYCKGDAYPDAAIWNHPKGWLFGDVQDQYWDEVQKPVTHWMPMPSIPAGKAQRCDYPNCAKACGDARGYCHKATAAQAGEGGV